ncbi:glycosyltransferase family 4 protein [Alginatibacterium sediminis]|nr:glycosyltransferase family 4 protein [Alginatibacterium sediminis]
MHDNAVNPENMLDEQTSIVRPKLLWIKADPLHPLNSGGKIRTYNMMVELKKSYDITFFALNEVSALAPVKVDEYSDNQVWVDWKDQKSNKLTFLLSILKNFLFSTKPFVIDRYTNTAIRAALSAQLESEDYQVVICDFLSLSANLDGIEKQKQVPYVVFQHNVESRIWERYVINAGNFLSKFYFTSQWKRYLKYEKDTCSSFDGVIAVSEEDEQSFKQDFGLTNVLGNVPTGVDIDYFSVYKREPTANSMVFLGSMDWMPNVDGISDFVRNVYPLIKLKTPDISLTIVGRNPPEKITALGKEDPSITVTGTVDDIRPYLAKAAISVVPLRIGGGTRIKIFETMAANLPVVSTRIGAEGLPVSHNKDILLADEAQDFANEVCRALSEPDLAANLSKSGYKLVKENYGWNKVTDEFVAMLQSCKQKLSHR